MGIVINDRPLNIFQNTCLIGRYGQSAKGNYNSIVDTKVMIQMIIEIEFLKSILTVFAIIFEPQ